MELGAHLDRVMETAHWGPWRRSRPMKLWRMVLGRYRIDGVSGISKAVLGRVRRLGGRLVAKATNR
jgi:hypothetical protein